MRPYCRILRSAGGGPVHAFFAVEISSIGIRPDARNGDENYEKDLFGRQIDFITTLAGAGSGSAYEIRFVSEPVPSKPHHGVVRVALRGRVTGSTDEEACRRAREGFEALWPNLLSLSDAYDWLPVESEEAYNRLFEPFAPAHFAELVRREAVVELDRVEGGAGRLPVGFKMGSAPAKRKKSGLPSIHTVFPYVPTRTSLDRLFAVLQMQSSPVAVSVVLAATRLGQSEEAFLLEKIDRCEKTLQAPVGAHIEDLERFAPPLKHQARALLEEYTHEHYTLSDTPFIVRVLVASPASISPGLMGALGVAVTEHVCATDRGGSTESAHAHFSGGYDWAAAASEADKQAARAVVDSMDGPMWVPTVAPEKGRRLRYLMDAREARAVFRLPIPTRIEFPGLETRHAVFLPPPPGLPEDGILVGEAACRGIVEPVRLLRDDRRRHVYVLGQTGTGKSSLLLRMILEDIRNGDGVGVLDPHGELIDDILPRIPENRLNDVIYVDSQDRTTPVGINLLENRNAADRDFAVNQLLEIFEKLYDLRSTGGPVFELYFRNAALLSMMDPDSGSTLAEVEKIFTDGEFRDAKISRCDDPFVREFWTKTAPHVKGEASLREIVPYVVSKLSRFIYNDLIRPMVAQNRSTIDMSQVMDGRKILLVDLCKGKLGETNASFLGMILMSLIVKAAFGRTDATNRETLPDFYLYVDEFQNLATPTFVSIVAEARKYRLCLTVTNQYLHQVPEPIQNAIVGNVGTLIPFRLGMKDAQIVEEKFQPAAGRRDLVGLPNYHAYVSALIRGEAVKPFSLKTVLDASPRDDGRTGRIRDESRKRYGKPRAEIDAEIWERWARIYTMDVE